jgi:polyhydroxyalkanoate synthesis regulator phasin
MYEQFEGKIKAEAYKEFAEELKEKFETSHLYGKDRVESRIDNLLKEMVDNNG